LPVDAVSALAGDTALAALVRGGGRPVPGAACSRERCPASVPWCGCRLDRHREVMAAYGDGLACHGPAGSRPALAQPDCALPVRMVAGRVPGAGDRGRSAELADRLAGFVNLPLFQSAS